MNDGQFRVWARQYAEDLKGFSELDIRNACARYRRDPENKFMATSGQLRALCRSPFDDMTEPRHRHPPYRDDLPKAMERDRALELIEKTRARYPLAPEDDLAKRREEALSRPPLPPENLTPERVAQLAKLKALADIPK